MGRGREKAFKSLLFKSRVKGFHINTWLCIRLLVYKLHQLFSDQGMTKFKQINLPGRRKAVICVFQTLNVCIPVFTRASNLEWSLFFCTVGVSFKSTSIKFPLEPFDGEIPANSDVVSDWATTIASLASEGKNKRAKATAINNASQTLSIKQNVRDSEAHKINQNK